VEVGEADDRTISILVFISVLNLRIIQIYIRIFSYFLRQPQTMQQSMQQSFALLRVAFPDFPLCLRAFALIIVFWYAFPLSYSCIYSHFAAFFMQMRIKLHGSEVWKAPKAPGVALYAFLWHVTQLLALP